MIDNANTDDPATDHEHDSWASSSANSPPYQKNVSDYRLRENNVIEAGGIRTGDEDGPTRGNRPRTIRRTSSLAQSVRVALRRFSIDMLSESGGGFEDLDSLDEERGVDDYTQRGVTKSCFLLAGLFFLGGVVAFAAMYGGTNVNPFATHNSQGQVCASSSELDPISALKASSSVEDMENGAVASDCAICSKIGTAILKQKSGNAVDAAVATALCLGVVNPASSGMGGGAFILVHADMASHESKTSDQQYVSPSFHDAREQATGHNRKRNTTSKVTEVIDCRETAPGASSYDMFEGLPNRASIDGGLGIGIFGELRGLELAHFRHGILQWADVVKPAMELARDGFAVSPTLAHELQAAKEKILSFAPLARLLTKKNDGQTLLQEGDLFVQPALAKTLQAVMVDGADAIYQGKRAVKIVEDIQKAGGIVTIDDLSNYRPVLRSPLVWRDPGGFTMVGVPPPSSGGAAVIGAARFLKGYSNPLSSFSETLSRHRIVEACRHVFAIRMSLCDPAYSTNETQKAVADMVDGPLMEQLRQRTKDSATLPLSQYGGPWAKLRDEDGKGTAQDASEGDRRIMLKAESSLQETYDQLFGYLEDHGTSSLSVVDKDRNAVSITTSVNTYFGSGVFSSSTGIVLNNQMDDFAKPGKLNYFGLPPSIQNYIRPGKKPLSSMSPTLVFRSRPDEEVDEEQLGDIFMALGASGGPKIISAVLNTFINHALLGMPLYEAVVHGRIHDQLLYHGVAATTIEDSTTVTGAKISVPKETIEALERRGHSLVSIDYEGTVQAVAVDPETNRLSAVSDIRKGGAPAGY